MIEGLVSIIMPSYNAARFIGESINSVLLQTYSHWELLIADDCSKDNSVEVARRYSDIDERIKTQHLFFSNLQVF
jgi:teichuronic acid biosynthesis glycosyltransferase TuaG